MNEHSSTYIVLLKRFKVHELESIATFHMKLTTVKTKLQFISTFLIHLPNHNKAIRHPNDMIR